MKKIRFTLLSVVLLLSVIGADAREKFDRGIQPRTFIPKGQIFGGGTISFNQYNIEDSKLLILLTDVNAKMYTLGGRLFGGYAFANDLAVGVSFKYGRNMADLKNLNLSLTDDLSFGIQDFSYLEHTYTGSAFLRTYINLGESKRFGLYNDFKFSFGGGQGRTITGKGDALKGMYTKVQTVGLILSPGVTVFVNNFMAVEASVGILGVEYKRVEQTTNQVYQGSRESFSANFKIDLFSIGLGVAFYF